MLCYKVQIFPSICTSGVTIEFVLLQGFSKLAERSFAKKWYMRGKNHANYLPRNTLLKKSRAYQDIRIDDGPCFSLH